MRGGKSRDIPLASVVMQYLRTYVDQALATPGPVTLDTPVFWSAWGQRRVGRVRRPMTGKNIRRVCKTYGRLIGHPQLKPHDFRHGVAVEIYAQRHDLEQVRGLLGHTRPETTQIDAQVQPAQLKQTVSFYEAVAPEVLSREAGGGENGRG